MLDIILKFLTGDVTPEQWKFLRAFIWRCTVAFHMAYACGYLVMIGVPLQGFAQAQDVQAQGQELARVKEAGVLYARLGIVREIRFQTVALCINADPTMRLGILGTIDRLREDYRAITGTEYPEVRCP
jgi:hypothetical protein